MSCVSSARDAALPYDHASLIFHCCFPRYAPLIIHHDVRQSSTIFLSGLSSFFAPRHHLLPWRVHAKFPFAATVITHALVNRQPIINTVFCPSLQFHYSTYIYSCLFSGKARIYNTRWLYAEDESGSSLSPCSSQKSLEQDLLMQQIKSGLLISWPIKWISNKGDPGAISNPVTE